MLGETSWLRATRGKFSPMLRRKVLELYRCRFFIPCFLQKAFRFLVRHFRKIPVLVELHQEHMFSALDADVLAGAVGCRARHHLPVINGFSAKVNLKTLERLMASGAVSRVWYDRQFEALLDVASGEVRSPEAWEHGATGEGVGIAVLDTGIYPHADLTTPTNRIIAFRDFIKGKTAPYDDNGHGTHCAGDAASNGASSRGKYRGAAPEANLIGVKVLNKLGSGLMSDIIAGIQWCVDNREQYNIKVLSMSFGSKATASSKEDPLCKAVEKAWDSGIAVCVAAGNEGPEPGTISSPGIHPKVITVGALDDRNTSYLSDDRIAPFSSRGPTLEGLAKPDLVAPGVNIVSLRSPGSYLDKSNKNSRVGQWYTSLSGTSMATPVCAGIAALIISQKPGITPDELKQLMVNSSCSLGLDKNEQGAGLVDAYKTLMSADIVSPSKQW